MCYLKEFFHPKYETEDYFEERIPEIDDTEEIKQLEEQREEIDKQIKELRKNEIRKKEQQEQIKQREEETVNNLMKSLYENPFETDIPLIGLSLSECEKLAPLLKKWYEEKIKTNELNKKIGIEFTVNGHKFFWPLNNEKTLEKINNMFNGSFAYSVDQIPNSISDDETQINITWMDNIRFVLVSEHQKKEGERSHKPSAFFEYRLKPEYKEFEEILSRYQIFTHLDNEQHNKCREELKYNCLIYALKSQIEDKDTLAKMSNYFVNISHIPSHMLTDFCKTFDLNIVLYSIDEKGRLRKANDKNGGKFGANNPQYTFTLATFKNHYFIYEEVPVNKFYLNHMEDIKKYANNHHWEINKCWKVSKKQGNNYRMDTKKAHMSSLEYISMLILKHAITKTSTKKLNL